MTAVIRNSGKGDDMKFKDLKIGDEYHYGVQQYKGEKVVFVKIEKMATEEVKARYVNAKDITGGRSIGFAEKQDTEVFLIGGE
jgi:hypothetical protein